jgi:hypothetical protein
LISSRSTAKSGVGEFLVENKKKVLGQPFEREIIFRRQKLERVIDFE